MKATLTASGRPALQRVLGGETDDTDDNAEQKKDEDALGALQRRRTRRGQGGADGRGAAIHRGEIATPSIDQS